MYNSVAPYLSASTYKKILTNDAQNSQKEQNVGYTYKAAQMKPPHTNRRIPNAKISK